VISRTAAASLSAPNSFGPSFDLTVARDRVLGILLGNLVMTVVFTTVWPATPPA
jgi:multidrug resistance protein MdtO